ncbi:hypothetical protein EV426DRAFT_579431 [Tirmania nivea]|nr:hypothetical protein EV426DRAFT_579431 [Tirmania nivea]
MLGGALNIVTGNTGAPTMFLLLSRLVWLALSAELVGISRNFKCELLEHSIIDYKYLVVNGTECQSRPLMCFLISELFSLHTFQFRVNRYKVVWNPTSYLLYERSMPTRLHPSSTRGEKNNMDNVHRYQLYLSKYTYENGRAYMYTGSILSLLFSDALLVTFTTQLDPGVFRQVHVPIRSRL